MIPVYFPTSITISSDEGMPCPLLAMEPVKQDGQTVWDLDRIYLLLIETLQSISRDCQKRGMLPPVRLTDEIFEALPSHPRPVKQFLSGYKKEGEGALRVCLFNGGGGGLGDGIMFGPALEILAERLYRCCHRPIELDVFSAFPKRTGIVLQGIPGVRVKTLPMSMSQFTAYDAYVDFSGMLEDATYETAHMTDFALERMGIDPNSVDAELKEPVLRLPMKSFPSVQIALEQAHYQAAGKPLVAVIFSTARARTMPDPQVVSLLNSLSEQYQPVILMPSHRDSRAFLQEHCLTKKVVDLSHASTDFAQFILILAGLDAIVSVDTSAVHIGGALRKPTVGIFNSINKEQRIKYSPAIVGIQLHYKGKTCQAPCGRSKGATFIEGKVADGQAIRLDFGYACDEALDKDILLDRVIADLDKMRPDEDIDNQVKAIQERYKDKFTLPTPPCWQGLDNQTVLQSLADAFRKVKSFADPLPCPACGQEDSHYRVNRYLGKMRYSCRSCGADFFNLEDAGEQKESPFYLLRHSPLPTPRECMFLQDILTHLAPVSSLLWLTNGHGPWDDGCLSDLEMKVTTMNWQELACLSGKQFDGVVAMGVLDVVVDLREFFSELNALVKNGGIWLLGCINRNALDNQHGTQLAIDQNLFCGVGWQPEALHGFIRRFGLQSIWQGTTPVSGQSLSNYLQDMPPLVIEPPDLHGVKIKITGKEIAPCFENYLLPAFAATGQGRFCLALARQLS